MRKTIITLGIITTINAISTQIPTTIHAQQEIPSYWGKLAIEEIQSKYSHAKIVDYLHEGSEFLGDSTIEKFKLLLKDNDKEYSVHVRIEYDTDTGKIISIKYQEPTR